MNELQSHFFNRQTKLDLIGDEGQEKLLESHVLVVGAGGLGCSVISALARAGVGKVTIVDHDKIDISNLHRQVLYDQSDIGKFKAVVASRKLQEIAPWIECDVHLERLNIDSVANIFQNQKIIIDCTDHLRTKFFIHDYAYRTKTDLIISSIHKFDGQLQVFEFSKNQDRGCMRCLWDTEPTQIGSCDDNGVLGTVPAFFGTLQATEAIKLILGLSRSTPNELITFDLLNLELSKLKFPKNNSCPLCSQGAVIMKDVESIDKDLSCEHLDKFMWIDIRKSTKDYPLPKFIPEQMIIDKTQEEVLEKFEHFPSDQDYLVLCDAGVRSTYLTIELRQRGYSNIYNFSGGYSQFLRG